MNSLGFYNTTISSTWFKIYYFSGYKLNVYSLDHHTCKTNAAWGGYIFFLPLSAVSLNRYYCIRCWLPSYPLLQLQLQSCSQRWYFNLKWFVYIMFTNKCCIIVQVGESFRGANRIPLQDSLNAIFSGGEGHLQKRTMFMALSRQSTLVSM